VSFRFSSQNSLNPHRVVSTLSISSAAIDTAWAGLLHRLRRSTAWTRRPPPPPPPPYHACRPSSSPSAATTHRGKFEAMCLCHQSISFYGRSTTSFPLNSTFWESINQIWFTLPPIFSKLTCLFIHISLTDQSREENELLSGERRGWDETDMFIHTYLEFDLLYHQFLQMLGIK
jgi:hypothetical protein